MSSSPVRVRFAPAPTGLMHLGNIRQALINYLYARQNNGVFVLRIEDTDQQRMFDAQAEHIRHDLAWLGLSYDEGPGIGGPYAPYFQSQRSSLYAGHLAQLIASKHVYRCFCSAAELERKRTLQIELKKAPRYDRTCLKVTSEQSAQRADAGEPYIWRFKLEPVTVIVTDLVRGEISFDLANFSDFPLTRQDGSFTFIFANCVDDITMRITHVFRGEDHLSNSASQIMLYRAFNAPSPIFWHTPIICNKEGKKLSKRDFGFSLEDLRAAGFVPEAIINYLALLGQKALPQEILTKQELAQAVDFSHHSAAGTIRYDSDKLRWMNHEWIKKLPSKELVERCRPFLEAVYPEAATLSADELERLMSIVHTELTTLADIVPLLHGYFHTPELDVEALKQHQIEQYKPLIKEMVPLFYGKNSPEEIMNQIKQLCQKHNLPGKPLWGLIRIILTGSAVGSSIVSLFALIPTEEIKKRLEKTVKLN